ncbi:ATP-dependent RNA helicase DHX33-like [Rhopilema esculentum]|uniref:ATP-dependent RNA helicase DHX33-like n=1 Tax=Rhopilema esculentum TaxID=499914 RepID=UPI0031E220EF
MTKNPENINGEPAPKKTRLDSQNVGTTVARPNNNSTDGLKVNGHVHDRQRLEHAKRKLKEERRRLPIYFGKKQLISEVQRNENVIIMSETGSGKTTQVPQYLFEAGFANSGVIGCTQPRRVAAISIADRVAKEMGVSLGSLVGFTVRFEEHSGPRTKIKYMTDGILLREAIADPLLKKYSIIILDEAHERTIHTDVLFGVVKQAQKLRKENKINKLKIIIMSATLEAEHFAQYFNNAKVLYVEGRRHPIRMMYAVDQQTDYIHSALVSTLQIHQQHGFGDDILVFLTGQEEIESLSKLLIDCSSQLDQNFQKITVCPLFAALPPALQMKVFEKTKPGHRKIILATNIAETSITIPGVKYVIDTGMVKVKGYNPQNGLDMLIREPVSKAQARQRAGRAGRECPGICYRLYTEDSFKALAQSSVPEIKRSNLSSVVLNLLAMGISDLSSFDFMDPPSTMAIQNAIEELVLLGAVESAQTEKLTETGKIMANFPLDPKFAKCILTARGEGCTEEMLTIVAVLSVESITYSPSDKRDEVNRVRQKFLSSEGDHVSLLNIFKAHKHVKGNPDWCMEHFINTRAMKTVHNIRSQLRELCQRLDIQLTSCGKDFTKLRRSLAAGLFTCCAELQRDGTYQTVVQKQPVSIHPSSALFRCKAAYVVYTELVKTSKCYMRNLSVVDPQWLIDACPRYFRNQKLLPQSVSS